LIPDGDAPILRYDRGRTIANVLTLFRDQTHNCCCRNSGSTKGDAAVSPIALTDSQLTALMAAAAPLQPGDRGVFLEALAVALRDVPEIGDGELHRVAAETIKAYRLFDAPEFAVGARGRNAKYG
jgi:hypothetical protein